MPIYPVYAPTIKRLLHAPTFNATTSDYNFGVESSQNLGKHTILSYVYVTGDGEGTFGYIWSKTPSASANGLRLFLSSTGTISFGSHSSGVAGSPSRTSTATIADNTSAHIAATCDNTLLGSGIRLFYGVNNASLVEDTTAGVDGTTALVSSDANVMHIGNREGTDRTFNGVIYYVARWNRVLPLAELRRAQRDGPLSVPDGLVLCWANNRDYSQTRLVYASQAAVVMTGAAPLNPYLQRVPALPTYFNISAGGAVGWGPLLSGARNRLVIA